MSSTSSSVRIEELRKAISATDPTAFLIEARVIRRLVRKQSKHPSLALTLPHDDTQVVAAEDLAQTILPDELGLSSPLNLSGDVIVLKMPTADQIEHWPEEDLKLLLWRRLFHAHLDRELKHLTEPEQFAYVQSQINSLGQVEFDEAHHVLRAEQRLMHPDSRVEAFREWIAHYWEYSIFDPGRILTWFPSMQQIDQVDQKMRLKLSIEEILQRTKIAGSASIESTSREAQDETVLKNTQKGWSIELTQGTSERKYLRFMRRRDRSTERGNTVRAITSSLHAARVAPSRNKRAKAESTAESDLRLFVKRLREAIGFSATEDNQWHEVLLALAKNAIQGFWNSEKRLLYDLQKVCLDKERISYRVDLLRWITSLGGKPLRRPLYNLQEVQMAKHLASATSRLVHVRLSGNDREQLTQLLEQASHQADHQMRLRIREPLRKTLLEVGMTPSSFPEQVAMDKLVEDALDCISERGYISMGYLRDAISKNDLKLPDLHGIKEAWSGDRLLKADDQLDQVLDGVYRRGDFYLRWIQMISAVFFGTTKGRFATLFLIIPFGGALVLIEAIRHIWHKLQAWTGGHNDYHSSASATEISAEPSPSTSESSIVAEDAKDTAVLQPESTQTPQTTTPETAAPRAQSAANPADLQNTPTAESAIDQATDSTRTTDQETSQSTTTADASTWRSMDRFGLLDTDNQSETISVPPKTADQAVDQIVTNQLSIIPLVILTGFFLMALIHLPNFRIGIWKIVRWIGQLIYALCIRLPQQLLPWKLIRQTLEHPITQSTWSYAVKPAILVFVLEWFIQRSWQITTSQFLRMSIESIALSLALNSRIGRDLQELLFEAFGGVWNLVRLRWLVIAIDWIVEFFRNMLLAFERFLYAVDEWLRFHSQESAWSLVAKAILGFIWSAISFLIRIYINLLIEPTLHPVKHFPVVTVAHKIFLPVLLILAVNMETFLSNYMNKALAMSFTWFNIVFLPGFFGFAVWELKENWRLFRKNRWKTLAAIPVGSHGETVERLLRPGFHSGTLPKLFRKIRRLENDSASVKRFTKRRSAMKKLHHVTEYVHRFVDRDFLALVNSCDLGQSGRIVCSDVKASTNSLSITLDYTEQTTKGQTSEPLELVFQEQSGWVVAWTRKTGWLDHATDQMHQAFDLAMLGFLRKCGVFLIRGQVESEYAKGKPYDVQDQGLIVWEDGTFKQECLVKLEGPKVTSYSPSSLAKKLGLTEVPDRRWIFAASHTTWQEWERAWEKFATKN